MTGRLSGKVAIVTGAGSGIGKAIAEAYHGAGAKVVVADVSGQEKTTADALGDPALAVRVDVTSRDDIERMVEAAVEHFGGLHVICNCAGIDGDMVPTGEASDENWDLVLDVNLKGVFLGMRAALPAMVASGGGSIVNIASMAALVAFPGLSAYCASKAGVTGLTRVAAVEYASQGVRVNAICPGVVDTPLVQRMNPESVGRVAAMTPLGRVGRPEEIAATAVFLATAEASFITGAIIPVDGGYGAL